MLRATDLGNSQPARWKSLGTKRRLIVVLALGIYCTFPARGQAPASSEPALAAGRAALQQHLYGKAIRVLEEGLKSFPDASDLKLELGRAYLYDRKDSRAMELFREVLSNSPSNRQAKLELARAFAYSRDYEDSDRLFYDLLQTNADEASEVGLIRNLLHEGKYDDAHRELQRAQARDAGSRHLQQYQKYLDDRRTPPIETERVDDMEESIPEGRENLESLWSGVTFYTDSSGNRSRQTSQQFDYGYARKIFSRTLVEETALQQNSGPTADVLRAVNEIRLQPVRNVTLAAGGGGVRFDRGTSIGLYQGELGFRLARTLGISGGYSRSPVIATFQAAELNLTAQGWHTGLNWSPRDWSLSASGASLHFSDGNDARTAGAEIMRLFAISRISFTTGYAFSYQSYDKNFAHGYFDPSKYQSHLGSAGVRFAAGRHFRAEYSVHAGAESISGAPFQPAWDVTFRNRVLLQRWEFDGIYTYSQLAQASGAFTSHTSSFVASYRF